MSGKIPDMTARARAAVVSTDLVEVVDTAGTDNYKVLLADLMELAFDPTPELAAGLDAKTFTISNLGGLTPDTADTIPLGSGTLPFKRLHYANTSASGTNTARGRFAGGHVYWAGANPGDMFFGHDNVFEGFYAQRTTVANSSVADNSEDYTTYYQGGLNEEYLATGYRSGGVGVVGNTVIENLSGLLKGGVSVGVYDASNALGGSGFLFNARANKAGCVMQHLVDTDIFWAMRSGGWGMGAGTIKGWRIGGTIEHIEPCDKDGAQYDDSISFGLIGNRWSDVFAVKGTFTNDTDSAAPPLLLDQNDVSEEMMEFDTTIGTGNAIEVIASKTLTTTHFVKITIPGSLTRYIPCGTIA